MYYFSPGNQPVDPASFKPSSITVVEGTSGMVPVVLFRLRAAESTLLPFGYTERRLDELVKGKAQMNLCKYLNTDNF